MSRTKIKQKRIDDFPKPLRHALAYWCAWRNLGFDAAEIFFGFGTVNGEPDCVHLQLQTQGKVFTAMCDFMPGANRDKVFSMWQKLGKIVSESSTEDERTANYREFPVGASTDYFVVMAQAIHDKGIYIPELAPNFSAGSA